MKPRCVVVAALSELPPDERVWGTGGWLPPTEREALDWLGLIRLLHWDVEVAYAEEKPPVMQGAYCVIVAADPHLLEREWPDALARTVETGATVVVSSVPPGHPLADLVRPDSGRVIEGERLEWTGPGSAESWHVPGLPASSLAVDGEVNVCARLDEHPVVIAARRGSGTVVTLGFSSSEWRDASGVGSAFLRHLLVNVGERTEEFLDLSGLLVLRMDDPGSSQSMWCRDWTYPKLGRDEWARIASDLTRRDARLSIGYVPGWVDDGNAMRGELEVGGRWVERCSGRIHESWEVRYQDVNGHSSRTLHDHVSEHEGISALVEARLASIELHGYTHMDPDLAAWSAASDRYEAMSWYRELGSPDLDETPFGEHPLVRAYEALEKGFGATPTSLIPPGDEWTNRTLEVALDLGIKLVDSYYLALRINDRFCWTTHVCAPYLDLADESWFLSGLPVVGYFHDYEPSVFGLAWMTTLLDRWAEAGARRMTDLRTLAELLHL